MDRAQKELVMNLSVTSFVLSFLYSLLLVSGKNPIVSGPPYASDPGDGIVVIFFFLILYVFHVVLSVLSYAVTLQNRWTLSQRLVLFHVIGLAWIGIMYFFVSQGIVFSLILSLVVFTAITILNQRRSD